MKKFNKVRKFKKSNFKQIIIKRYKAKLINKFKI